VVLAEKLGRFIQGRDLGAVRLIESMMLRGAKGGTIDMPILAVCGPPRTGSTLIYQVITQGLDVFFINNFQHVLCRVPLVGYRLSKRLTRPYISGYKSTGGFVPGLNGPAEAMEFWRYWCDFQLSETPPCPDQARLKRFARLMNKIYDLDGRPLLAGYLAHAFYFKEIHRVFPRFIIIRTVRDMLASAVSGLRRWRQTDPGAGDESFFFGVRPRECLGDMTRHEYVARQQYFINKRMDEQEDEFPGCTFYARYPAVCADPRGFISSLSAFVKSRGIQVRLRTDTAIPDSFRESTTGQDHDEDTGKIAEELDRLHAEFGPTRGMYIGTTK